MSLPRERNELQETIVFLGLFLGRYDCTMLRAARVSKISLVALTILTVDAVSIGPSVMYPSFPPFEYGEQVYHRRSTLWLNSLVTRKILLSSRVISAHGGLIASRRTRRSGWLPTLLVYMGCLDIRMSNVKLRPVAHVCKEFAWLYGFISEFGTGKLGPSLRWALLNSFRKGLTSKFIEESRSRRCRFEYRFRLY